MTTKRIIENLVNDICKVEGKEHNASKADVAEIIGIVSDASYSSLTTWMALSINGARRAESRAKRQAESKAFLASKRKKK